jgi:hypothetical protein
LARIPESQPGAPRPSIVQLRALVDALSPVDQARATRLLHISEEVGSLVAPSSMHPWIVDHFGSVTAVERQTIVRTTNLVTFEGAVFNPLRAARPIEPVNREEWEQMLEAGGDPFCHPLEGTPADAFGRVQGRYSITASNIAKYGAWHAVVIFDNHHPLHLTRDAILDALEVGLQWGRRAVDTDPEARYVFFMWNCLWKAGASILHGHAQVTAIRGMHYPKIEALRRQTLAYRVQHETSYFEDLVALHRSLGLSLGRGDATILASLTPVKEKEVVLLAEGMTDGLRDSVAHVVDCFVHRLGVTSFNLALYMPPFGPTSEDWAGFPHMVRIVDRGPLQTRTADFGAMELYAASVISSDPFRVIDELAG